MARGRPGADRRVRRGDRRPQWIHVDPVRAAEGPFGTTIAHGYLTLSLCVPLMSQALAADRLPDEHQLRRQQGALPRARPVRLADPSDVHRGLGGGGAGRRAEGLRHDGRARGRRQARLRGRARDPRTHADEPLHRASRAHHRRREAGSAPPPPPGSPRGRARRHRRLRRGRGARRRRCDRRPRRPLRRHLARAGRGGGRRGGRDRAARHPRHLRRDHPRQPAPQDDGRRLGGGDRDAPARHASSPPRRRRSTWWSRRAARWC